jgi:hypothetical protein
MMADRVIRDELLTSERYWKVSIEAQRLFIHILLNADDTARFSGKNYTIRSACFPDPDHSVTAEALEKLISELHDADLIRLYTAEGERFVFIPRFKQRLRFTTSKYPAPPSGISDLLTEKSDSSPTIVSPKSDSRRQKRREVKRSEENKPPLPPLEGGLDASPEKQKTNGAWWQSEPETLVKASEVGITPRPGEDWGPLRSRIRAAINAKKEAA